MRIDSFSFYSAALSGMRQNQEAIARLNQQIATGSALLATRDDPVAAEKIMDLTNRVAAHTQFAANQDKAEIALKYEATVLSQMNKLLSNARGVLTNINPDHDPDLRDTHAQHILGVARQLQGLANTRDAGGNYIFAGFNTGTQPYASPLDGTTATTYAGTALPGGTRSIDIEVGRPVQVTDNLDSVFQAGVAGNDLLLGLSEAALKLPLSPPDPNAITQADLDGYLALIDQALSDLGQIEHRIAGALTEIADTRVTTQALLLQEKTALGDLSRVDEATAIVELQLRQTALEAAGRAYARTSGLSLFNYLG